ncbi:unnamed protein product [Cylicocyclus nassatus]|uniref:Uncharacterized protein n=1 Tax=Cylicocyclus nassatus TaxID=53992 RepID=A0AA36DRL5_CYLNA|nr:unnamed protein product [Cylicocyclus nassatus]
MQSIWWTILGKDDRKRLKAFDMLSQARMDWVVFARIALGRALRDVRAYVLNPLRAKLLPPKIPIGKRKLCRNWPFLPARKCLQPG